MQVGAIKKPVTFLAKFGRGKLIALPRIIEEKYRVGEMIDSGGFGNVYHCKNLSCVDSELIIKFVSQTSLLHSVDSILSWTRAICTTGSADIGTPQNY